MRWVGNMTHVGERGGAYRAVVRKPEGKRPLGGPGRRWKGNITVGLQEMGWWTWTGLFWLRMVTSGELL